AQKSLKQASMSDYYPLQEKHLPLACKKLSESVGRDTDELPENEVVRGTIETVAENTPVGITAPLFWAFIGGAPFALSYRAINMCDSVVGYKTKELKTFGKASARLDDFVNWIPARLTGFLMLITKKSFQNRFKKTFNLLRLNAKKHKSQNIGWNEDVVAIIVGVPLGGTYTYHGI